jgi:hypothetical protein
MRTKILDCLNTAKAKKVEQASKQLTNRFTTLSVMDVDLMKIWRKTSGLCGKKMKANESKPYASKWDHQQSRGAYPNRGRGRGQYQDKPLYCMFQEKDTDHRTRDCTIFLESKKKMAQKPAQPSASSTGKEVNHTAHWHQPSQSSSSNQPSYQTYNHRPEYHPNYHRYPLPYNCTPHANQTHTPQVAITYPSPPLQITYPTTRTQTSQQKIEPNNPPPPQAKNLPSKQQAFQPLELSTPSLEVPT